MSDELSKENKVDFSEWWNLVGSGITPTPSEDMEEFAARIALRAFSHAVDLYYIPE